MAGIHNYYLSHMRTGLAVRAQRPDPPAEDPEFEPKRNVVNVELSLEDSTAGGTTNFQHDIAIYGPGDVLGFNPAIVVKTTPIQGGINFRADHIPYIEFAEPDFLWRYSTVKEGNGKYWLPWLSLILLKSNEEFSYRSNDNEELPPTIELKEGALLPELSASWRWAHVHVMDAAGQGHEGIAQVLKQSPQKAVCRLMSPRRLQTFTRYAAFVVPTYKLGLQAAKGEGLTATLEDLAWESASEGQVIPYYYRWEFDTGPKGDFETLVKQLQPHFIAGVGKRFIDCHNPGYGMEASDRLLEMEGALQSLEMEPGVEMEPQKWGMDGTTYPESVQEQLGELINSHIVEEEVDGEEPEKQLRVVPPIYGRWYVSEEGMDYNLLVSNSTKNWIEELNLDFRHRAVAGLGVAYVKDKQEELMRSAWKQMDELKKANKAASLGRFGRAVSGRMYRRIPRGGSENAEGVATRSPGTIYDRIVFMAQPLHNKLLFDTETEDGIEPRTIKQVLNASSLNYHALQVKTKKYLRKHRPLAEKPINKAARTQVNERSFLLSPTFQMNGLVEAQDLVHDEGNIHHGIQQSTGMLEAVASKLLEKMNPSLSIEQSLVERLEPFRLREERTSPAGNPALGHRSNSNTTGDLLRDIMWYPEFHTPMYRYLRDKSQDLLAPGLKTVPNDTVSVLKTNPRFIEAFMIGLNHEFASELRWREFPTDMHGSYFRKFWDTTIYSLDFSDSNDPQNPSEKEQFRDTEIGKALQETIADQYGTAYDTMQEIENVFVKPGELTAEEKAIALAYEEAVEKWMLSREEDKDIKPLYDWGTSERLGYHALNRNPSGGPEQLVLLLRGELLRQFPNVLVYLASKDGSSQPNFQDRTFPIFEGHLPPDVLFLGFPISASLAGNYYIVFEEPMSEIKYGLDEKTGTDEANSEDPWTDTSWQHFMAPASGEFYLDNMAPSNSGNPGYNWDNPAVIARVFTQHSVRLAIPLQIFI